MPIGGQGLGGPPVSALRRLHAWVHGCSREGARAAQPASAVGVRCVDDGGGGFDNDGGGRCANDGRGRVSRGGVGAWEPGEPLCGGGGRAMQAGPAATHAAAAVLGNMAAQGGRASANRAPAGAQAFGGNGPGAQSGTHGWQGYHHHVPLFRALAAAALAPAVHPPQPGAPWCHRDVRCARVHTQVCMCMRVCVFSCVYVNACACAVTRALARERPGPLAEYACTRAPGMDAMDRLKIKRRS